MALKRFLPCVLVVALFACQPPNTSKNTALSLYKPNLPTYSTPKNVNASITGKLTSFSILYDSGAGWFEVDPKSEDFTKIQIETKKHNFNITAMMFNHNIGKVALIDETKFKASLETVYQNVKEKAGRGFHKGEMRIVNETLVLFTKHDAPGSDGVVYTFCTYYFNTQEGTVSLMVGGNREPNPDVDDLRVIEFLNGIRVF